MMCQTKFVVINKTSDFVALGLARTALARGRVRAMVPAAGGDCVVMPWLRIDVHDGKRRVAVSAKARWDGRGCGRDRPLERLATDGQLLLVPYLNPLPSYGR